MRRSARDDATSAASPTPRTRRPTQLVCRRCRFKLYEYPRLCVGFVLTRDEDVLVLTRGHEPRRGFMDLPGGFLEEGEEFERAARRELLEETALRVGAATLLGTYWDRYDLAGFGAFPTLNYYYVAPWRSGVPRAGDDAAHAEWLPLRQVRRSSRRFAWEHMRRVLRDLARVVDAGGG